ncbi:MAG: c-type cytochrome [Thiobacillus sp.]|uniref:c-type cytochrome n=1 Tax=Thiobacillus sp. TaxID=924 RepID=UPI0027350D9B|nr:c-type cytochrome [Thiobacillus sp.]MDP3584093.1 c-type cytochrome [Thiobacillus sp.]
MNVHLTLAAWLLASSAGLAVAGPADDIRHGRYLIQTTGCNDCHTPGFMQKDGQVPESEWLTGDAMGWQGPWGTTYPANLRLLAHSLTEAQWVARARQPMRPPMPSPSLRAMTDADLKAIYRYVKSLPLKGPAAPAYVPPGGKVATPYLDLTPKNLPPVATK